MNPILLIWLLAQTGPPAPAPAPTPTPEAPAPDKDADLERKLQEALDADTAAAAATPTAAPSTPATSTNTSGSQSLMNPAMSVIGTFSGGWRRDPDHPPPFIAGDDPAPSGLTVQELELAFASDVDPYFKMRAFLTIPRLEGIEIEEAYLITTDLPRSLQVKAGIFRSQFGRNNEQHLHMQDFARRPLMTYLLGDDGLRPPTVQVSYLLPLPWFATLYAEVMTVAPNTDAADQLSFTGVLEQFFDLSDTWSLLVGLNFAALDFGPNDEVVPPMADPPREYLADVNVYLKWKPTNVVNTYVWVAFTGEYIVRKSSVGNDVDGAGYAQLVAQVARRWRAGLRFDATGVPHADGLQREYYFTGSLAFLPSEFSRIRLTYSHEDDPADSSLDNDQIYLQLEGAIGAHGAHPF